MAQDILKGQWKQMRGQMRVWWGKLTDDDLEQVQGNYDKLLGLLQAKYGYDRAQAESEINRRLGEYRMRQGTGSQTTDYGQGQRNPPM